MNHDLEDSNRSANRSIHEVSDPARRVLLRGSAAGAVAALVGGCATGGSAGPKLGFKAISADASANGLRVPEGYVASVIAPWGEPVGVPGNMPAWKPDASNSAVKGAVMMAAITAYHQIKPHLRLRKGPVPSASSSSSRSASTLAAVAAT